MSTELMTELSIVYDARRPEFRFSESYSYLYLFCQMKPISRGQNGVGGTGLVQVLSREQTDIFASRFPWKWCGRWEEFSMAMEGGRVTAKRGDECKVCKLLQIWFQWTNYTYLFVVQYRSLREHANSNHCKLFGKCSQNHPPSIQNEYVNL